ncbi:hypothetical protein HDU99_008632, partial [Rhizoclosmatium hyalinum]
MAAASLLLTSSQAHNSYILDSVAAASNVLSSATEHPIGFTVRDLTVSITSSQRKLYILQDISINVPAGTVLGIMGASGSGKTTLLSVLAGKAVGLDVNGNVLFNGNSPKPFQERGLVAFVPQQDYLIPYLTVRETLRFAARLKLPKTMKISEKYATVETVIAQVGLVDCSDSIIGDSWRKGISGGEKRRVS